jgi:hypothetical protein
MRTDPETLPLIGGGRAPAPSSSSSSSSSSSNGARFGVKHVLAAAFAGACVSAAVVAAHVGRVGGGAPSGVPRFDASSSSSSSSSALGGESSAATAPAATLPAIPGSSALNPAEFRASSAPSQTQASYAEASEFANVNFPGLTDGEWLANDEDATAEVVALRAKARDAIFERLTEIRGEGRGDGLKTSGPGRTQRVEQAKQMFLRRVSSHHTGPRTAATAW